jgi:hypothetical protein
MRHLTDKALITTHRTGLFSPFILLILALPLAFNSTASDEAQTVAQSTPASLPAPYRAEYQAKASGLSATAYRTLERLDEQRYRLSNNMSVTVFGAAIGGVIERSDFILQNGHTVRPISYTYDQTGLGRRSEHVHFDWENGTAETRTDKKTENVAIVQGVMDQLSFTAQLSLDLAALPAEQLIEDKDFIYQIVDGDKIDEHRYVISGRETITTSAGAIPTIRLERIRAKPSSRTTTFWLAQDQDFLLVRLEQTSGSGDATQLLLQSVSNL